ncbi:uncharacterized protein LOC122073315 isoform X2 [Macadamia integrifolia]|uniref:uncharacterized protein LOC122073315 isoform X2 n=1 Tax=Macadamia integrifolia TaxID=60698 RepID=UPI001C4F40FD|nr:uncharacterized protein LOC122073315 isoform X2 [Macadamia integrifolia]
MGNCQAAEAASVVIQHPVGNKTERIYWSLSVQEVMNSNPGHYVALHVTSHNAKPNSTPVIRHLKLLRPDDTLHIGQVYRLITFDEVLKEFAATKSVKLGRLIKETTVVNRRKDRRGAAKPPPPPSKSESDIPVSVKVKKSDVHLSSGRSNGGHKGGRHHVGGGQWRPALQSIAEVGT